MLMSTHPGSCRGATLIEVLVTIVLLSFGALSLAGLHAYSVAAGKNAVNRGLAAAMAADLADLIRVNPIAFAAGNYTKAPAFNPMATAITAVNPAAYCQYPDCTTAQLAALDMALFTARLKATLRAGTYAVVPVAGSTATRADIYVMWQEQRAAGATSTDEASFDSCPATIAEAAAAGGILPRCFYARVNL
jgi:type IV pilus assembly protein PilV